MTTFARQLERELNALTSERNNLDASLTAAISSSNARHFESMEHEAKSKQLERELAEAMDDAKTHKQMLQNLSKTHALERAELDRSFQFLTKQRDALAEALGPFVTLNPLSKRVQERWHGYVLNAKQALAALKGELQ